MRFRLTPQCRTMLVTLVGLVSIMGAMLTAAKIGVEGVMRAELAPMRQEMTALTTRQQDMLKSIEDIQDDVRWLIRDRITSGNTAK